MNTYMLGSVVRLEAAFAVDGLPTDPDTVEFIAWEGSGPSTSITPFAGIPPEIPQTSGDDDTGRFYGEFEPDTPGLWTWRVEGDGTATAAAESHFYVHPRTVPEP